MSNVTPVMYPARMNADTIDAARLHRLITPALPITMLWVTPPDELMASASTLMRDTLPPDLACDLTMLSNVRRDGDEDRAAFLTWWYQHTDWSAYRVDPAWRHEGTALEAARWELNRIHGTLSDRQISHLSKPDPRTLWMVPRPWLLSLDDIDIAGYIRIRLGYHQHDAKADDSTQNESPELAADEDIRRLQFDDPTPPHPSDIIITNPSDADGARLRRHADGSETLRIPQALAITIAQAVSESRGAEVKAGQPTTPPLDPPF